MKKHIRFAALAAGLALLTAPLNAFADEPQNPFDSVLPGDANLDNTVDIMDVLHINKQLLGVIDMDPLAYYAADVDKSDLVDQKDALLLLKYILEMIDSFDNKTEYPVTENARLLAAAEYPDFPSYPVSGDGISMDYSLWKQAVEDYRNQPEGYQDGFDTFFNKSTPVFLQNDDGENRIYSPLSLYMALGMSAEITDGDTRQQILDVLAQKDLKTLRSHARSIWQANYMDDGMAKSLLATSLWTNDTYTYRTETLDALTQHYYASAFSGKPGSADYDKLFQSWMSLQTGGNLEDYVSDLHLDPASVLTLASTVDFSGKWYDTFDEALTESGTFHAVKGDQTCEFMKKNDDRVYYCGEGFGAIHLKLENNGYMRLILPDEGVTPEQLLTNPELMRYLTDTGANVEHTYTKVHITVPKFDVSSKTDLNDGLQALGIKDLFDKEKADFSPLTETPDGIFLSSAEQDARVAIDEEGCKASALTVMQYVGAPMPKGEVWFTLDRPFMFEIMSETDLPLFVGIVNQVGTPE